MGIRWVKISPAALSEKLNIERSKLPKAQENANNQVTTVLLLVLSLIGWKKNGSMISFPDQSHSKVQGQNLNNSVSLTLQTQLKTIP